MRQITYISTAPLGTTEKDIDAILATSRRNNRRDGITGLLISDGTRFLQALEGEDTAVEAAYARIKVDRRHRATVILSSKTVDAPQFGSWDMAFEGFAQAARNNGLGKQVDRLVAQVGDPNIRALFSSFARIDRYQSA